MTKDSGLGCHMGTNFMGAVGYADDIVLLPPSVRSLIYLFCLFGVLCRFQHCTGL